MRTHATKTSLCAQDFVKNCHTFHYGLFLELTKTVIKCGVFWAFESQCLASSVSFDNKFVSFELFSC